MAYDTSGHTTYDAWNVTLVAKWYVTYVTWQQLINSHVTYNTNDTFNHLLLQDTEFPGVVARPIGEFKSQSDYQYQLVRVNVDQLKIIQLGFTFMDDQGNLPTSGYCTWQFNFQINFA